MGKLLIALVAFACFIESAFLYPIPSPEDYFKAGRKWLTFKNIPDGKVVQIDSWLEIQEFMRQNGKQCVLLFYDDRTRNSHQLFPLFEGLAITLDGVSKVGAVSVSTAFGQIIANLYDVQKVPSVFFVNVPSEVEYRYDTLHTPYGVHVQEYSDGLSIENINKAALLNLSDDYIDFPTSSVDFQIIKDRLVRSQKKSIVVLLTRKKNTTDLFKTLSYKYAAHFLFVQIPYSTDLASELMEKFDISKPKDWGPLLFLHDTRVDTPVVLYDEKKFDVSSLSSFFDQHVQSVAEVAQAQDLAVEEMLQKVNCRCRESSSIEPRDVKALLSSATGQIVIGILGSQNEERKIQIMKNIACSFTLESSIHKVMWMKSCHALELEKLFEVRLKEGFIALDPAILSLAFEETEITMSSFRQFKYKQLTQKFDVEKLS